MNETSGRLSPILWLVLVVATLVATGGEASGQTLIEQMTVTGTQSEMMAQQGGAAADAAPDAQSGQAGQPGTAAPGTTPGGAPGAPAIGGGAGATPVFLLSPWKPVLVLLVLVGWAWVISHLDKDAAFYYLPRYTFNLVQMACGVIGFGLMLLIPFFFVGFLVGLVVLLGGIGGYAYYRNTQVPPSAQWTLSLDSFTQRVQDYQQRQAQKHATLVLLTADEQRREVPTGEHAHAEAHTALEGVIDFAVPRGADVIQITVDPQQAQMAARIDGVKYPQGQLEPKSALVLIDYLKEAAGLDVADRRKRQHGSIKIDAGDLGRHTLELETAGSTRGLQMLIHIDGQQRKRMPLTHLGLLESQREQITQILTEPGRVVILTGPPMQGLSTTSYSLLNEHDPYTSSLLTFEDEVLFELEGITHNEIGGLPTPQFNERLGASIRSDPNVIMISRALEPETVQVIARNAEEIRFYVGMQEDDTFAGLGRWIKLVGNRKLAAESLAAVVSQRLIRRLCMTCRTPYKPDPAALRKLNLPVDRVGQLYHSSGQVMDRDKPIQCPDCMGLGYKNRVGVFEIMQLDDAARSLIAKGDLDTLRGHLRKQRMLLLNEAALAKVVEGVTDVKEITRALGKQPGNGGAGGKPPRTAAKPSKPSPAA